MTKHGETIHKWAERIFFGLFPKSAEIMKKCVYMKQAVNKFTTNIKPKNVFKVQFYWKEPHEFLY